VISWPANECRSLEMSAATASRAWRTLAWAAAASRRERFAALHQRLGLGMVDSGGWFSQVSPGADGAAPADQAGQWWGSKHWPVSATRRPAGRSPRRRRCCVNRSTASKRRNCRGDGRWLSDRDSGAWPQRSAVGAVQRAPGVWHPSLTALSESEQRAVHRRLQCRLARCDGERGLDKLDGGEALTCKGGQFTLVEQRAYRGADRGGAGGFGPEG